MTGRSRENYNRNYINYVHSFAPPTQHFKTCTRAFCVGGLICCIGQFFRMMLELAGLTGDILAVLSTGAYNYSMASNYNRNFIPPAVLVKDGKADYIVRPQSYEDLVRNDVIPDRLK